jgi:SAM-dependent methyltransferase
MNLVTINKIFPYLYELNQNVDAGLKAMNMEGSAESTSIEITQEQCALAVSQYAWKSPSLRNHFKSAFQDILNRVTMQWEVSKANHILEVGCGFLNPNGTSHLSSYLSEDIAEKFTYTDLNPGVNTHKNPNFKAADMTKLSGTIDKAEFFDVVMASCCLDAFPTKKLPDALQEISKVLTENGLLISTSDQFPYFNSLTDYYTKEGKIIFPLVDEDTNVKGLQVISPEQLDKFIPSSNDAKKFLEWYRNLSPARRDLLVSDISISSTPEDVELSHLFSKLAQEIPGMETIKNRDFFDEHLKSGLKTAGLAIQAFTSVSSCFIAKVEKIGKYNYISHERGHLRRRNCYVLAPGHIYYHLSLQLVVAQKKSQVFTSMN